jgi:hypothetical protein
VDVPKEDVPFIPGALVETTSLLVSLPQLILNYCIMSTKELNEEESIESSMSSMPCKQMSLHLALLWPTQSTEIFSMDPNSKLDSFALYLLHFSAYYDMETSCIHFSNITSTNELLSDQMRCSMDWSLVCKELSMSNMTMTTTRKQSQKIMELIPDTMDSSCRLDETALNLLKNKLPSTPKLPNNFLLDEYTFSCRAMHTGGDCNQLRHCVSGPVLLHARGYCPVCDQARHYCRPMGAPLGQQLGHVPVQPNQPDGASH